MKNGSDGNSHGIFAVAGNPALRHGLSLGLGAVFAWLLWQRIAAVEVAAVLDAIRTVQPAAWIIAAAATWISFIAVGRYDVVLHRIIGSNVPDREARRAGQVAIAFSQTLGFGLLTGSFARWRMLPRCSPWKAARLTLLVSLSFLAGWAVVTSVAVLTFPAPGMARLPAVFTLGLAGLGLILCIVQPSLGLRHRRVDWPTARALMRLPQLAAVDTLAAAFAFWILLPEGTDLALAVLLPAFLIALGAGLITGTPGGVGPFELTLLALLPATPETSLLAAVLAFRLVYYALPAAIAGFALLRGVRTPAREAALVRPTTRSDVRHAPRAEAGLLRAPGTAVLTGRHGAPLAIIGRTGQSLIAIGEVLTPAAEIPALDALRKAAARDFRHPCFYKCGPRQAARARASGWSILQISREALVRPCEFDLSTPARRQLRRKLRKTDRAGVTVRQATTGLPLAAMRAISETWAAARGGERGFSMGRFCETSIRGQRVFLAYQGDRLIAFVTFQTQRSEWALDLMRNSQDCPDGTMHLLVAEAIADAARMEVDHVSLAAAPAMAQGANDRKGGGPLFLRVCAKVFAGDGLARFKSAFAPEWRPLYVAAPTPAGALVSGLDIALAIRWPGRISNFTHDHYDSYEFASSSARVRQVP